MSSQKKHFGTPKSKELWLQSDLWILGPRSLRQRIPGQVPCTPYACKPPPRDLTLCTLNLWAERTNLCCPVSCVQGGYLTSRCPHFLQRTRPCSLDPKISYNISEIGMHLTINVMSKWNQQQCFFLKITVRLLIKGAFHAMKYCRIPFSSSDRPW